MKLSVLILALIPAAAFAQSSRDYATMSLMMWAAFQCGYYAASMDDTLEAERLYNLGVEEGRDFLVALEAGQLDQADMQHVVPVGVSLLLGGPSHDFIIGRIFESVMMDTAEQLYAEGNFDEALARSRAQVAFQEANCASIR